jgi:hypothetical protein
MKTQNLCALWVGGELSYIERLCLTSMLDTGHKVALYTYLGVPNAPTGVDMRDGREVMPERLVIKNKREGSFALGSDFFRYHLLQKQLGCWVDTDMVFIKPLAEADYIFGYETETSIGSGVLKLPADCPIITETLAFAAKRPVIAPWWPVARKWQQYRRWLRGKSRPVDCLEWAIIGPLAVTHFAEKHNLHIRAESVDVFYPNSWMQHMDVFDPAVDITKRFTQWTVGVHLWHTAIKKLKIFDPPAGSFIDQHCKRLVIMPHEREAAKPVVVPLRPGA